MPVWVTRRTLLRLAAGTGAAAAFGDLGLLRRPVRAAASPLPPRPEQRRLIIVVFGGGTRSSESIADPEHRHVPRLWNELVPRGTLLTNVRVEHKVVHPNCTASLLTGHNEWDDNDWSRPVAHPTVFEMHRRARAAPDTDAWAFMYASILAQAGQSRAPGYGPAFAANVVEPPTIPRTTADEMTRRMHAAAATGSSAAEAQVARDCARLARSTSRIARGGLRCDAARAFVDRAYAAWKAGTGTTSHDAFLADGAIACMREFTPRVLVVAFGEIDCAHYGSWSRYVEAIRRTDELTWRLWCAAEELDAYRSRTLLLIVPDHGRELDRPGRWGFIHHSNFYTNEGADEGCRRVWMVALGPGIAAGRTLADPVPSTATAATGLDYLGLCALPSATASILPRLSAGESALGTDTYTASRASQ